MELNSEQLLTQVVKNSWDRRFGEDIGDLAGVADVVHLRRLSGDLFA